MVDAKGQVQWAELLQRVQGGPARGEPNRTGTLGLEEIEDGDSRLCLSRPQPQPHTPAYSRATRWVTPVQIVACALRALSPDTPASAAKP